MKTTRIVYWTTTSVTALMMIYSAYNYLTAQMMQQAFHHLGFPDYFRVELAVAKLAGAVLLLAPVGPRIKEWVYAGFAFTFVSAFIAHASSGDPVNYRIMPLIFLALLAVSYVSFHRTEKSATDRTAKRQKTQLA